jgi:hypothetical protein
MRRTPDPLPSTTDDASSSEPTRLSIAEIAETLVGEVAVGDMGEDLFFQRS